MNEWMNDRMDGWMDGWVNMNSWNKCFTTFKCLERLFGYQHHVCRLYVIFLYAQDCIAYIKISIYVYIMRKRETFHNKIKHVMWTMSWTDCLWRGCLKQYNNRMWPKINHQRKHLRRKCEMMYRISFSSDSYYYVFSFGKCNKCYWNAFEYFSHFTWPNTRKRTDMWDIVTAFKRSWIRAIIDHGWFFSQMVFRVWFQILQIEN